MALGDRLQPKAIGEAIWCCGGTPVPVQAKRRYSSTTPGEGGSQSDRGDDGDSDGDGDITDRQDLIDLLES